MDIIDFSATKAREPVKHHAALPNSIRAIIIGPSGSGKTQLLLNLIMRWMKWEKLYLIAPSVDDQRCYEVLKDFIENTSEIKGENVIEFITGYPNKLYGKSIYYRLDKSIFHISMLPYPMKFIKLIYYICRMTVVTNTR